MEILTNPYITNTCFATHRHTASPCFPQLWASQIPGLALLQNQKKYKAFQTIVTKHSSFTNKTSYLYPRSKLEGNLETLEVVGESLRRFH